MIVTTISALLQPVPTAGRSECGDATGSRGETSSTPTGLLRWLVDRGFERVPAIEVPGEFCMHGGIFDLFPADAEDPVRIELFGNEVESIRRFDAETQRKLEDLDRSRADDCGARKELATDVGGSPAEDKAPLNGRAAEESLIDSLPAGTWIALCELGDLVEEAKNVPRADSKIRGACSPSPTTLTRLTQFPSLTIAAIAGDSYDTTCHLRIESIERFQGPRTEALSGAGIARRPRRAGPDRLP